MADFDVSVSGLPAVVRAGSTTEPFTVTLDNTEGADATRVQFGLAVAFRDGLYASDWLAAQRHVVVQYFDWGAGTWQDASSGGGVYAYTDVEAGHTYEMRLRLRLAPDTPPGAAGALAFSTRWVSDGPPGSPLCRQDDEWYRFEITSTHAAATTAEVRPQGGRAPAVLRPASRTDAGTEAALPDGALAETGAGQGLPLVALASLTAVALGATALRLAARRRRL
ncbi:hypothetical protein RM572_17370 [Streptomyces sp. DSM 42041]|uniref:Gram-positive cocci surface proteins LPxTG domain-containing protein n=1 Tax=Streptomyces hazeniae TaxID=3075538 RepID=A0ABU2NV77_9ACTN|nr:hypothetical protein [Streptomyces sp. DSM 42041]MDT0380526.1 hypothetical protein [Streptomyces sp. DSM 42041]